MNIINHGETNTCVFEIGVGGGAVFISATENTDTAIL